MECTIVGIKKGTTKGGKDCFNYYGTKNFSDYDLDNSECFGKDIVSAFSYKDFNLQIGDVVDLRYEPGFEGRATLDNIVVIKPAGGNPFDKDKEKAANK